MKRNVEKETGKKPLTAEEAVAVQEEAPAAAHHHDQADPHHRRHHGRDVDVLWGWEQEKKQASVIAPSFTDGEELPPLLLTRSNDGKQELACGADMPPTSAEKQRAAFPFFPARVVRLFSCTPRMFPIIY